MPAKLLVPIDGSEGAVRAVEYVARTFGHTPGVKVKLIHILPGVPPSWWDDGHILNDEERQTREQVIADWEKHLEKQWQGILAQARNKLKEAGIPPKAISAKFQPQFNDVAEDLLEAAEVEGYTTIVMGRRGLTGAASFFLGSVSQKVVHHARNLAVIIVDHTEAGESQKAGHPGKLKARSRMSCWERFLYFSKYWSWI
jgi:nucleotide-binding universal stress UspA family protein